MTGATVSNAVSRWVSRLAALVVIAFVVAGVSTFFLSSDSSKAAQREPRQRAPQVTDVTKLVASTTNATIDQAPRDDEPQATTEGDVVHPTRTIPLFAEPGGRPFAKITPNQMGETWLPVVDTSGEWSKVLLPSRPNGSTGWLRTADVETRRTPYLIRVHVGSRELELFEDGALVGTWTVAVGAPETPTPTGRSFLLGSIIDDEQTYSPVILPLGSHSDTLDTYGGGPGTVALHGWPDDSVFGNAVSNGCIRVPDEALDQLTQVPLGSLVLIDDN